MLTCAPQTRMARARVAIAALGFPFMLGACSGLGLFNTGEDTVEAPAELLDFQERAELREVWSASIGGMDEHRRLGLTVATDGDQVYVADPDGEVIALDLRTGRRAWRRETDLVLSGGPAADHGLVVVGSEDGELVALEAADGSERWRSRIGGEQQSPVAIAPQHVAARTVDGRLVGLDAADGNQLWEIAREEPGVSLRGISTPVASGGVVYAGFDGGVLMAVRLADGEVIWEETIAAPAGSTSVERMVDIDAPVALVGEDLYVASYQGRTAMVATESGQLLWTRDMSSYAGIAGDWSQVYVTDDDSVVHALDRLTGVPQWSTGELRARFLTAPIPFGRGVAVGDFEGYLHLLSKEDGSVIARERFGKGQVTRPVVAGELLLVYSRDGSVSAYRLGGD